MSERGPLAVLQEKDAIAGALFLVVGLGFAIVGSDYGLGSARRMGPGYFPVLIGGTMATLGAIIAVKSVLRRRPDLAQAPRLRPVASLALAVVAFGLLIDRAGMVAAILACITFSAFASSATRLLETAIVAVVTTVFSAIVFVWLLGLPMRLWIVP